jgi:hypothetical protein
MANLSQSVPYLLVGLVFVSVASSVIYIGMSAGNSDTRNELQKQVAILTGTNVLTSIFLGFLLYYYLMSNIDMLVPFTAFMVTFNLFLGIMAVSISVLQQLSA